MTVRTFAIIPLLLLLIWHHQIRGIDAGAAASTKRLSHRIVAGIDPQQGGRYRDAAFHRGLIKQLYLTPYRQRRQKQQQQHQWNHPQKLMQQLRGGSTTAVASAATSSSDSIAAQQQKQQLHAYRLQQQLYLQSRSLQLRQALIQRGFDELQHCVSDANTAIEIDWDCALATDQHPKSCLYSFDAPITSKVLAPVNTTQYITLSALNRLRRNDPTKIEPLWHSQYKILNTWFHPNHPFSLYTHLGFTGTILAVLLDTPWLLAVSLGITLLFTIILALPILERIIQWIVTMPFVWQQWPSWGRFVHAALPLKLLLGQMGFKYLSTIWNKLFYAIRNRLVEVECNILEECIPLTIVEDDNEDHMYERQEPEDNDSNTDEEQ